MCPVWPLYIWMYTYELATCLILKWIWYGLRMCSHYSKFKALHKHNEEGTQVLDWVRQAHKTHATKLHLVEVPQIWLSIFRSWKENSVCGYFWGRFNERSDVVTLITYYENKLDINNMSSETKGGVCYQVPCSVCRPQQSISARVN